MARINVMTKEDKFQVKVVKALTQELETMKQEQASLAQRYRELSNNYANATSSSICVASLEKENQMLKTQVESLTSKCVSLQGTHKELEYSYEKLADSHAMLEVAYEVVLTSVKSYQPLSHTCTCSQASIMLSCDKLCCSQATNTCVEHVVAKSCDDLIAEENYQLKREVEELKMEMTKLKSKCQVQPSQDNRDDMVKKLEKGSNLTTSAPQQGQSKRKSLVQVKKPNMGQKEFTCPMQPKNKTKLSRKGKATCKN